MLRELDELTSIIKYLSPTNLKKNPSAHTFLDVSFNISKSNSYGKTGLLKILQFNESEAPIYRIIYWYSCTQLRVYYYSYGANILACTDDDDRGFINSSDTKSLFPKSGFNHELKVY